MIEFLNSVLIWLWTHVSLVISSLFISLRGFLRAPFPTPTFLGRFENFQKSYKCQLVTVIPKVRRFPYQDLYSRIQQVGGGGGTAVREERERKLD